MGPATIARFVAAELDVTVTQLKEAAPELPKRFFEASGAPLKESPETVAQLQKLEDTLRSAFERCRRPGRVLWLPPGIIVSKQSYGSPEALFKATARPERDVTVALNAERSKAIVAITEEICKYVDEPRNKGVVLLTGHPGDGKTTTLHTIATTVVGNNRRAIHVEARRERTYPQIVTYLHAALLPDSKDPIAPDPPKLNLSQLVDEILQFLRETTFERVLFLLDDFELFGDQHGATEAVISDTHILALIESILTIRPEVVRMVLGTNAIVDDRVGSLGTALDRMKFHGQCRRLHMPPVQLSDMPRLVEKNRRRGESVKPYLLDFTKSLGDAHNPSTLLLLVATTAFCVFPELSNEVATMEYAAKERRKKHLELMRRFILSNDLGQACAFFATALRQNTALELQEQALMVLALHEDGCAPDELSKLLCAIRDEEDSSEDILSMSAYIQGDGLAPMVRISTQGSDRYDLHPDLRHALVRHWESTFDDRRRLRRINRAIATRAFKRWQAHATPRPSERITSFRDALMFFVHQMASIDPKQLREAPEIPGPDEAHERSPAKPGNSPRAKKAWRLQARFLGEEGPSLGEAEHYCFACHFLFEQIDRGQTRATSRLYAADELRLDLLCRAWYPGYYEPPSQSPLRGNPAYVPHELEFLSGVRKSLNKLEAEAYDQMKERLHQASSALRARVAADGAGKGRETPSSLPDGAATSKAGEPSLDPSAPLPANGLEARLHFAHVEIARAVCFLDEIPPGEGTIRALRNRLRTFQRWNQALTERLMHAAARLDRHALFASAWTGYLSVSEHLGDQRAVDDAIDEQLKWRYRRGHIESGTLAARDTARRCARSLSEIAGKFEEKLKAGASRSERTRELVALENTMAGYQRVAGRYGDFLAMHGDPILASRVYRGLESLSWNHITDVTTDSPVVLPRLVHDTLTRWMKERIGQPIWRPRSTFAYSRFVARQTRLYAAYVPVALYPLCDEPEKQRRLVPPALRDAHGDGDIRHLRSHVKAYLDNPTDSPTGSEVMHSDWSANIALELATWRRVEALSGSVMAAAQDAEDSDPAWMIDWTWHMDRARGAAKAGNVSVFTQLRLVLEEARGAWQRFLLHPGTLVNVFTRRQWDLETALRSLDGVVAVALSRSLLTYQIAALLLRYEITRYLAAVGGGDPSVPQKVRGPVSTRAHGIRRSADPEDLLRALDLMEANGCQHRRFEAECLRHANDHVAIPVFYLGA